MLKTKSVSRHLGALSLALAATACTAAGPYPEPLGAAASPLTIAGLFSTGVDGTGTPLAAGAVDPHYVLSSNDAMLPGPHALAVNPAAGWAGNTPTSKWISGRASTQGAMGDVYTYTTTFPLPAVDPASLVITGQWSCDDGCVVQLNGTQVAQDAAPAWGMVQGFVIPGGSPFQAGTNTLAFVTTNTTGGPTGLQVVSMAGGCFDDDQCSAAQFCDTQSNLCVPKLPNGTAVPTIPGHTPALTGTCTSQTGAVVCVSGVCDTKDNDCGYANGDGPCTMADGPVVCRSTICATTGPDQGTCVGCTADAQCSGATPVCDQTTGTCVPGCHSDADCASADWCDAPPGGTGTCVSKLDNGVPLPSMPSDVSTCTAAVGMRVCKSGVCDPVDNACGLAAGDGPCTTGAECRNMTCDTNRQKCSPSTGCTTDADCPAGDFCASDGTCTPKLPDGMPCDAPNQCVKGDCASQLCGTAIIGSGNGLICAAVPARPDGDGALGALGLALAAAALGRRRRRR